MATPSPWLTTAAPASRQPAGVFKRDSLSLSLTFPTFTPAPSPEDQQIWSFVRANLAPEPRREFLTLLNVSARALNAEVEQVTRTPVGTFDVHQLPQAGPEQPPHEGMFSADGGSPEALVCKAIGLGNFEAAVDLCLSQGNIADALMLGINGG